MRTLHNIWAATFILGVSAATATTRLALVGVMNAAGNGLEFVEGFEDGFSKIAAGAF